MTDQYDGPAMAQQILRLRAECGALKVERDALLEAIRFLFDHGAYLTERIPDHLQAAIDAARGDK